jgi:hypothetical protein
LLQIQTLRGVGFTYEAIASDLKITLRQVQYACTAEHPTPSRRSGRPAALSDTKLDELIDYIKQSKETRRMSYLRLATEIFPHWELSKYAIRSGLRRRGFRRYIALAKPPLSPANQRKRLAFAEEHVEWAKDQWCSILWSDETWVNGTTHRKVWITRCPGEELKPDCVIVKRRRAKGWVFWGSFHGTVKGPCLFWEKDWGTIGAETYCQHIVTLVDGWIRMNPGLMFMQDNALGHAAASTVEDLRERGIIRVVWPPFSPDLNPIETVWCWMKDWIQHRYGYLECYHNCSSSISCCCASHLTGLSKEEFKVMLCGERAIKRIVLLLN